MPPDAGPPPSDGSGRRAASRGATALVLTALVYPALLTWVYFVALSGQGRSLQQGIYLIGKLLQFSLPLLWVLWLHVCHGHLARASSPAECHGHLARASSDALAKRPWHAGIAQGVLFGAAVVAAMLIGYHAWAKPAELTTAAGEAIRAKLLAFGIDSPAKFVALGAFYSLAHSLLEEYYWRWFAFGQLRRLVPPSSAIAISSVAFAAHHVILLAAYFGGLSATTCALSFAVALGGAYWAWLYQRTGSLVGPWLSHLLVDAGIFIVGYELAAI